MNKGNIKILIYFIFSCIHFSSYKANSFTSLLSTITNPKILKSTSWDDLTELVSLANLVINSIH